MSRSPRWGLPGHWVALAGAAATGLLLDLGGLALGGGEKAPATFGLAAALVLAGALAWPGSGFGTGVLLTLAAEYYLATLVRAGGPIPVYVPLAWVLGLYLLHALLALAAALPRRAGVDPAVFLRWARRTARTLVPGLLLAALAVVVDSPGGAEAGVRAVGMVAVLAAVAVPVWLLHRRDRPRDTIKP